MLELFEHSHVALHTLFFLYPVTNNFFCTEQLLALVLSVVLGWRWCISCLEPVLLLFDASGVRHSAQSCSRIHPILYH